MDEVLNARYGQAELTGKRPLIPDGDYNDCTVSIVGAQRFTDEDTGQITTKVEVRFACPHYDGDLTARLKMSMNPKAPWAKLVRACFPEIKVDEKTVVNVRDMQGKRVNIIVEHETFNGNPFNTFAFRAASAKK